MVFEDISKIKAPNVQNKTRKNHQHYILMVTFGIKKVHNVLPRGKDNVCPIFLYICLYKHVQRHNRYILSKKQPMHSRMESEKSAILGKNHYV